MEHLGRFPLRTGAVLLAALCSQRACAQRLSDFVTPTPLPPNSTLLIGFLGGYERWNDDHRSVRKLVLQLRHNPGVYAGSVSNHRRSIALRLILHGLDSNHDGSLDPAEKARARVVLFGQSWGGAAAIATARDLDRLGVPVLLAVQVDSIGFHDGIIPCNVRAAVNFYQHDPLTIQGRREIRAADPASTAILGNIAFSYVFRPAGENGKADASWARRTLGGSHARMELDPNVWRWAGHYIAEAIERR